MKKIAFALTILFSVLLNMCAVSAESNDVQPNIKTTIQKFSNYSAATVKLTAMPDRCAVITAQYQKSRCTNVEIRKYKTETEVFYISGKADTVKVLVWEDTANIKPVVQAEIIDMQAASESDIKIEKIANNLRGGKNQNVTTYKTEENEPRAIIWTKGIYAPLLSEFEKEVEITDPNYSFLYAGQDKGSGWYDVNKSLPQEDGADRNMCYAAVSANQLHWWLDQNKNNIDAYLNKLAQEDTACESQAKLDQLKELMNSYEGQSKSGIYNLFRRYFESPVYSYNANLLNDFFINGYQADSDVYVNSPDFFKWDPRGGFFYDVFKENLLTNRFYAGDYTAFKRDIIYYMKEGQSIGIIHKTPAYNVTHIITLWGVELDCSSEITALFVTDSDDYDQPEIGMKRMLLKKNSSGYPVITTNISSSNTGALILEFVPLSQGEEYWNKVS